MKKKEKVITVITILFMIVLIIISVSYAFFRYTTEEDEANQFKAACYNIEYSEPDGTGVEILNAYPITDEEAEEEKGYKFTVTNNCEETIKYNVIMNIKNESTTDENLIRVSLNDEVNELSELTQVDSTLSDTKYGYRLKTETLQPTQVREYEVKAWLGEDTQLGEGEDTEFLNQISIEILKESKNALAYKIKANNTLIEETPDFRYPFPYNETTQDQLEKLTGLYKTVDDDGDTYYFRGAVENNYVNFANMQWRIVRINGDGTVRLVLDNNEDWPYSVYNEKSVYYDRVGYTYNNGRKCTKSNPCTKDIGTSSLAKQTLETWYEEKLSTYDEKIALGRYCSDTSHMNGSDFGYGTEYSATLRFDAYDDFSPILTCPDTKEEYGGNYKLKIGLLTADEVLYSGTFGQKSPREYNIGAYFDGKDYYPYLMTLYSDYIDDMGYYIEAMWSKSFWTMTPCNHIDEPLIYEFWMGEYYKVTYDDYLNKDYDESKAYPRPVINLNADVEVSAGDGSSEHPFEIKP